jgi:hypothetical protein
MSEDQGPPRFEGELLLRHQPADVKRRIDSQELALVSRAVLALFSWCRRYYKYFGKILDLVFDETHIE